MFPPVLPTPPPVAGRPVETLPDGLFEDVDATLERPGISWATTPMMTATPVNAPATVHRNTRRTRSNVSSRRFWIWA